MFSILIEYSTGNSYGSEVLEEELPVVFNDCDEAIDNLERIKEHHEMLKRMSSVYTKIHDEFDILNDYKDSDWLVKENRFASTGCVDRFSIESQIILTHRGSPQQIDCFWVGHFERLISARVILTDEDSIFRA